MAVWDIGGNQWESLVYPIAVWDFGERGKKAEEHDFSPDGVRRYMEGVKASMMLLAAALQPFRVDTIYYEQPHFMETGKGGAAARRGDFAKLCMAAGALTHVAVQTNAGLVPVSIMKWKGNLPKKVVWDRIKDRLPDAGTWCGSIEHRWDAVGIGLHVKGFL